MKLVFDQDPTSVCSRGQKVRKFDGPPTTDGRVQVLFTAALNSRERRNYRRKVAREALGDLVPVIEQIKAAERSGENRFQSGAVLIRKDEDTAAQAIQAAVDKQVEAVEQAAKQASEAARK